MIFNTDFSEAFVNQKVKQVLIAALFRAAAQGNYLDLSSLERIKYKETIINDATF